MLLTLTTSHHPATDWLSLHKHPGKAQSFDLPFGKVHVFYPRADEAACTAAILLDIDPVALVRGRRGSGGAGGGGENTLDQYVNNRPYVASSFLSVAISQVLGTALAGNCKDRPELVTTPIPLTARLAAVPCRAGDDLLPRLFEPLGYTVTATRLPLDPSFPDWGNSPIFSLELSATKTLSDLLTHLYVLIPVLDNRKHYFVGDAEVEKLLRHGEGWLAAHPERELIAARYLKHRSVLLDSALRQLREQDGESEEQIDSDSPEDPREEAGERRLSLHQQRHGVILSVLQARDCRTVIDLGCGEAKLLRDLIRHSRFERVVGMDVSHRSLQIASDRLRLDQLPPTVRARIDLLHGSLLYRDSRIAGFDAAVLCEVIEHLDEPRLAAMERAVFEFARPRIVIITTPNREHNVMWDTLPAGRLRHRDHRFEWTRAEFRAWAAGVCSRRGYTCEFRAIGEDGVTPAGENVGPPTQMGVFTRETDRTATH